MPGTRVEEIKGADGCIVMPWRWLAVEVQAAHQSKLQQESITSGLGGLACGGRTMFVASSYKLDDDRMVIHRASHGELLSLRICIYPKM